MKPLKNIKIKRARRRRTHPRPAPPETLTLEQMCRERWHHTRDGRFENPWGPLDARTVRNVIRWKMERGSYRHLPKEGPPPVLPADIDAIFDSDLTITPLGHATILIQINGVVFLTDPVFSDLSVYLRRKTRLPMPRKTLKRLVHGVLVSHNHYDHFSLKAVRSFRDRAFFVPLGFRRYFRSKKYAPPICLDWFERVSFKGIRITFLPAQHWSRRTLRDTNRTLWGSFLLEGPAGHVFYGGDTGYYPGFKEIGERFRIDVAILPIGAFAPRWLMKAVHLSPYEAVRAALDLKAKTLIPCHWGTYQISEEPLTLPIQLLERIRKELRPPIEIVPLLPGETFRWPSKESFVHLSPPNSPAGSR